MKWNVLIRKMKYAAGVVLTINAAIVVAMISGATTWQDGLKGIVIATLPTLTAYLVSNGKDELVIKNLEG